MTVQEKKTNEALSELFSMYGNAEAIDKALWQITVAALKI
jgi:hypothetical protein